MSCTIHRLADYRRTAPPPEPAPAWPSPEDAAARRIDRLMEEAAAFLRHLDERAKGELALGQMQAHIAMLRGVMGLRGMLAELERLRFPGAHE